MIHSDYSQQSPANSTGTIMRSRIQVRISHRILLSTLWLFLLLTICPVGSGANQETLQPRLLVVNQRHRQVSDQASGTESHPFKTLSRAAELARPGDTVLVHAGTYREWVAPATGGEQGHPITYQAAPQEQVLVKGSELFQGGWRSVAPQEGIYSAILDQKILDSFNPYATRAEGLAGKKTLGQVFVDGAMYTEVDDRTDLNRLPGTWMAVEAGQSVLIHFSGPPIEPQRHKVEYSVRNCVFAPKQRGLGYITVRGFIFEHCANQGEGGFWEPGKMQAGMVSTRAGHHWIFENNIIRHAKSLGMDMGDGGDAHRKIPPPPQRPGRHLIRQNTFCDNGEGGIAGIEHQGTRIVANVFERNNCLHWDAIEEAALKTHFNEDGLIEANLFRDNECPAIWIDNTYTNVRITRNLILHNAGSGIFMELGHGPALIDNNVIAYNNQGIYAHDAAGIVVAHNLLMANAQWGIHMRVVTDRTAKKDGKELIVQTSHERIINNIILDNYRGAIAFSPPWERSFDNQSDFNLLGAGSQWEWLGIGGPTFALDPCEGRISQEKLLDFIRIGTAALPEKEAPNLNLWDHLSLLTLDQWKTITGFEKNSSLLKMKQAPYIGIQNCVGNFHILEGHLFRSPENWKNDLLTRDFLGKPIPLEKPLAGPFQNLREGENLFPLWPIVE